MRGKPDHERFRCQAELDSGRPGTGPAYHRDRLTWTIFSGLFGFGVLNAILGPALPYLRAEEHLSYVSGELHQMAFAVGGGLAGLLAIPVEARRAGE